MAAVETAAGDGEALLGSQSSAFETNEVLEYIEQNGGADADCFEWQARFVEVKGPNDSLSDQQIVWLNLLAEWGDRRATADAATVAAADDDGAVVDLTARNASAVHGSSAAAKVAVVCHVKQTV